MAHYAILDENNVVTQVIVGKDETDHTHNWEEYYGGKRTSYNTSEGIHKLSGTPFRKNYAGIGFTYDQARDAFIPQKNPSFSSWILNEDTCQWNAPTPMPDDSKFYDWNEATTSWDETEKP
tara:strand:+ start:357 stop:719 length:363 start_codon:yes stop_codon:yes gene_type:complete